MLEIKKKIQVFKINVLFFIFKLKKSSSKIEFSSLSWLPVNDERINGMFWNLLMGLFGNAVIIWMTTHSNMNLRNNTETLYYFLCEYNEWLIITMKLLFPRSLKLSTSSSQISQDIWSPLLRTKSIIWSKFCGDFVTNNVRIEIPQSTFAVPGGTNSQILNKLIIPSYKARSLIISAYMESGGSGCLYCVTLLKSNLGS